MGGHGGVQDYSSCYLMHIGISRRQKWRSCAQMFSCSTWKKIFSEISSLMFTKGSFNPSENAFRGL